MNVVIYAIITFMFPFFKSTNSSPLPTNSRLAIELQVILHKEAMKNSPGVFRKPH